MTCNIHKNCIVIFRRFRREGDKILDARAYGYKAWPIHIRVK